MELLWSDFLNSDWHDWHGTGRTEDRLNNSSWLADFLARWHLSAPLPPSPQEVSSLQSFRSFLRSTAEAWAATAALSAAAREELNSVLSQSALFRRIVIRDESCHIEFVPANNDWQQVAAEIAASFAQTLSQGESGRIRICKNPDCHWIFYDDTRSRTKQYCSNSQCGNLLKVRRFRQRKATAETETQ